MSRGRPAVIPNLIRQELAENGGQIQNAFDLANRRIGCSSTGLNYALRIMQLYGEIEIERPGSGRPIVITQVEE